MLTAAADSGELPGRASGLLRETGWFVAVRGHGRRERPGARPAGRRRRRDRGVRRRCCPGSTWSGACGTSSRRRPTRWRSRSSRNALGPEAMMTRRPAATTSPTRCATGTTGSTAGVVDEVDATTMRIKATVPAVLGETSTWCLPCVPYAGDGAGFCFLPDVGAGVWIEFEGGDVGYPIWVGLLLVERARSAVRRGAGIRVIVTASGHKLIFDDDAGEVRIADSNGGTIVLDSSAASPRSGVPRSVAVGASSVSVNDGARGGDVMGTFLHGIGDPALPARRDGHSRPGLDQGADRRRAGRARGRHVPDRRLRVQRRRGARTRA